MSAHVCFRWLGSLRFRFWLPSRLYCSSCSCSVLIKKFSPGFSVFLYYDNRNSFDASPIKSNKRKKEICHSLVKPKKRGSQTATRQWALCKRLEVRRNKSKCLETLSRQTRQQSRRWRQARVVVKEVLELSASALVQLLFCLHFVHISAWASLEG